MKFRSFIPPTTCMYMLAREFSAWEDPPVWVASGDAAADLLTPRVRARHLHLYSRHEDTGVLVNSRTMAMAARLTAFAPARYTCKIVGLDDDVLEAMVTNGERSLVEGITLRLAPREAIAMDLLAIKTGAAWRKAVAEAILRKG